MKTVLLLLVASFLTTVCSAKILWLVPTTAPIDRKAVLAQLLRQVPDETAAVLPYGDSLLAWTYQFRLKKTYDKNLTAATSLFVSLSSQENEGFALLALLALREDYPSLPITIIAEQKPVYKMTGLCNNHTLQKIARLALQVPNVAFAPLPKVWQRVYTDDNFYEDKVPKNAKSEAFIYGVALTLSMKGENYNLKSPTFVSEAIGKDLLNSIRKGYALKDEVLYAAERMSTETYNTRHGLNFTAVLFDGSFEHAIGEWLLKLAQADGRKLELLYTTETTLATGYPCLFRTTQKLGDAPNANVYTRPAFKDDTGLTELDHLTTILQKDGARKGYVPFQVALARWMHAHPTLEVYDEAVPQPETAALLAAMLYVEWTGTVVIPKNTSTILKSALSIGYETQLQLKTLHRVVNACRLIPVDATTFKVALWRPPRKRVTVQFAVTDPSLAVSPATVKFTDANYAKPQVLTLKSVDPDEDFPIYQEISKDERMILWKLSDLVGVTTGIRDLAE